MLFALIGLLSGIGWWLAIVGALLGAAVAWWMVHRTPDRVLAGVGAVPLTGASRLENLIDGLCLTNGIPLPALMVVETDARNTATVGIRGSYALVVTRGLLDDLSRIELEGVVARQLWLIKSGHAGMGTLVAAIAPFWAGAVERAIPPRSDVVADVDAVGLTRYPPGLLDALEKIDSSPALTVPKWTRHLWIEDPGSPADGRTGSYHSPLDERIATLREL